MRTNKLLGFAAVSLALLGGATAQAQPYSNAVMALNPVAYWPLTESVSAPSGLYIATNSGTLGAAGQGYYATWYQPFGTSPTMVPTNVIQHAVGVTKDSDGALQASMTGQNVTIPRYTNGVLNAGITLSPPFSIELWVYPTNTGGSLKPLVSEGFENVLNGASLGNQATSQGASIGSYNNIIYFVTFNGAGAKTEIDTAAFAANTWHHIVATFDGTTMRMYDNAAPRSSATPPKDALGQRYAADMVSPLRIGCGGNQNSPFGGIIDEVAIYTNVLTAQQVTNHFYAQTTNTPATYYGTTVLADNPSIYLRLDEPAFTSAPALNTCPVANNYGSLGSTANGYFAPGTTPAVAGPTNSGFGATSRAVALNGFNGGIDVPVGSLPSQLNPTGTQPMTIAAWFKGNPASCVSRFQEIIGHSDYSWRLGLDFNAGNRFNAGSGPELLFPGGVGEELANGMLLNDGNWHFVAGTFDGTTESLYLDGILAKTATVTTPVVGTNLDVILGGDPQYTAPAQGPTGGRSFDGNLAHVAFFTNALSAAQVQGLYSTAGSAPVVHLQPASQAAIAGQNVTLTTTVSGSTPITYQWYKDGGALSGQTSPTLPLGAVTTGNAGAYYLAVTNSYGWTTSLVAQVTVTTGSLSPYGTAVTALNPVAYWPLNETTQPPFGAYVATNLGTAGIAGQGYYETWFQQVTGPNGQPIYYQTNNIQHVAGAIGDGGQATMFNRGTGQGQYLVFPRATNGVANPVVTLTPPFSVEFWAKPQVISNAVMCIVTEGRNPALDSTYSTTNESGFSIGQYGANLFFATWNNRGADSTKYEQDVAWTAGTWHHVVVTFDGTNKTVYLDNVANTQTLPNSIANAAGQLYTVDMSSPLVIGTGSIPSSGNGGATWWGALAELAIYTNVLQSGDVANHFNAAPATDNSYVNAVLANSPTIFCRLGEPAFNSYPSTTTYPVALNYGTAGGAANGSYQPGTSPGAPGPQYSGMGGASSKAVAINGFSGAVEVGNGNLPFQLNPVGNQPQTVALWMKGNPADAPQRFQNLVSHGNGGWRMAIDHYSAGLRWNPGNNPEVQYANVTDVLTNVAVVNDGRWHYIAGVSDGSSATLYIDGVPARTNTGVGSIGGDGAPTIDVLLGGDPSTLVPVWNGGVTSSPRYFDGSIAQVAYFTNALTAAQISQLYGVAGVPPTIALQPQSQNVNAGTNVALSVIIQGSAPLTYQWYKGTSTVSGGTASSLVFNPVVLANAGNYYVVVTNSYGSVTSVVATLSVVGPPVVQQQSPTDVRVFAGTSPTLRVGVIGPSPAYQWYLGSTAISGATASSYTIPGATASGVYTCVVTNSYGAVTNAAINVSVLTDPAAVYPHAVLADHPISYYRLWESSGTTAYDYAGGLNGTYTNVLLNQQPGYSTNEPTVGAAQFGSLSPVDSFAGYVSSYQSFAAPTGSYSQFSVEAWVNGGWGQSTNAGIVTCGYGNGGEQFTIDTGGGAASDHNWRWFVRDAAGIVHKVDSATGPKDNNWHHVVGVCDQTNALVKFYVDGILQGSSAIGTTNGILAWNTPLSIGSRQSGTALINDSQLQGYVNDVALYNYALSDAQVANHYLSSGIAPLITMQPTNTTANDGGTAYFYATAIGTAPLSYQWYDVTINPVALAGQTNATLTLSNVSYNTMNNTYYQLTVTNIYGQAQSTYAQLTVFAGPPNIDVDLQPLFMQNYVGAPFTYSVSVSGTQPRYQWKLNGANIPGATKSSYTTNTIAGTNFYQVAITNSAGYALSAVGTNVGVAVPTLDPLSYKYRVKINLSGYNRGSSLSDFPLLVKIGTNLNGYASSQFASATGADLRFTDASGTRQIWHEIDEWNPNAVSTVWVQIPHLAGTNDPAVTNNYIYAYWGNSSATTPPDYTTNGAVWVPQQFENLPSFLTVYHMKESALPFADSALQHPATVGVAPAPATGIVGTGGQFDGASTFLDPGVVNLPDTFTLSAWVNITPTVQQIVTLWCNQQGGYGMPGFSMFVNDYNTGNGNFKFASGDATPANGNERGTGAGSVSLGQWHLLTASVAQTNASVQMFVDGAQLSTLAITADFPLNVDLNLGRFTNSALYFNGTIDEARIQNGPTTPDWVWASYMTVAQNNTFESYGNVGPTGSVLSYQVINGKLVLTWPQGTLLSGSEVSGVTNVVTGATSPYTNSMTGAKTFFRVKVR